ncbi:MAG TPA: helix-turn-helix transcriptional regulator [Streptosporangiaceae bacterium]|nr:helix-turn-helix transcriptional regulator [Streptosporangiaceae bacterium]
MEESAGPLRIPRWAWQRQTARDALRGRDVAALFRFAQSHTGASQARLALSTGISQGRVNEIVNGRRAVTTLDVFERVADGLGMPDDARVLLGLAPRDGGRRSTRATYEEIGRIFAGQQAASDEIREVASQAARIDVLAVRGLGLLALNDSLLWPALSSGPRRARVFLLDPDCHAAGLRAGEIGETPAAFTSGIRLAIERLQGLAAEPGRDLALYVYDSRPVWRVIALDDTLYVSGFATWEGHSSTMYKLLPTVGGALHGGFRRLLDDLAATSRQIA